MRREAVVQPGAAGALQIVLAAAAARPARGVRRVPGFRRRTVIEPRAVGMADHRGALPTLRPVAARAVVGAREGRAVRLRAGEDVVHVRRVATAVDDGALLRERGLLGEVVGAVELRDVLGDDDALGVRPRAGTDAVARVDGAGALRAQVRAPGLAPRPGALREHLAVLVGAGDAAQVAALAGSDAGDEEAHGGLLGLRGCMQPERQQRDRDEREAHPGHVRPPFSRRSGRG